MNPLLQQFLAEGRDQLQQMSESLLALERGEQSREHINELFRLMHTLKGASSLFTFPEMTSVLHVAEDLLTAIRERPAALGRDLTDLLLKCLDYTSQQLDEIAEREEPAAHPQQAEQLREQLRIQLRQWQAPAAAENAPQTDNGSATVSAQELASSSRPGNTHDHHEHPQRPSALALIPEALRQTIVINALHEPDLNYILYRPHAQCYFAGEDPFFLARQTPSCLWGSCTGDKRELAELDPYDCHLAFHLLSRASDDELQQHFQYVVEQIDVVAIDPRQLIFLAGTAAVPPPSQALLDGLHGLYVSRNTSGLLQRLQEILPQFNRQSEVASALRWLQCIATHAPDSVAMEQTWQLLTRHCQYQPTMPSQPIQNTDVDPELVERGLQEVLATQRHILTLDHNTQWAKGRLKAVANSLCNVMDATGRSEQKHSVRQLMDESLTDFNTRSMISWIDNLLDLPATGSSTGNHTSGTTSTSGTNTTAGAQTTSGTNTTAGAQTTTANNRLAAAAGVASRITTATGHTDGANVSQTWPTASQSLPDKQAIPHPSAESGDSTARMASDNSPRYLKVDQERIDRLMSLIGEMIVARNRLPFLASKVERMDGGRTDPVLRELARDLKEQHSLINRIAEEMQDTIMQIRMMPFSSISMRFPRLVRDIANRLGKQVSLEIAGEETEADKNIIEVLSEPLIHLVRNSLDHGLETPQQRLSAGKSAEGHITIRAAQEVDRVLIEVIDDGRGMDPDLLREKAVERGLVDPAAAVRLSRQECLNLILLPGFSTADAVTDLSGRGVGMDAVRRAIDKVNGTFLISSEPGKGTRVQIRLPMSIAATRVMMVETDGQLMGIPMDQVQETVRIPRSAIHQVRQQHTTVLREQILPLVALTDLLNLPVSTRLNEDDEYAVLVIRNGTEPMGLLVDNFRGSTEVIQKPLGGLLAGVTAYTGAALIGDGSVVMILNLRALL